MSSKTLTNISIGDASIKTSIKEKLHGIFIDSELSFDQHISSICSKAGKKLHALGGFATFICFKRHKTNESTFWVPIQLLSPNMDISLKKKMNNKINCIQEVR